MTKYIIEYCGGTKGDMLCRFLNKYLFDFEESKGNKTNPIDIGCVNWLKLANPNHLTLKRFEEVLSENTNKYLTSHPLWVTVDDRYVELLHEYDYNIIKLIFEDRYYITIRLESMIKNLLPDFKKSDPEYIVGLMNTLCMSRLDWHAFTFSDLNALDGGGKSWQNIWKSRARLYTLFLENNNDNRTFINYADLYINFNSDILVGYDLDEWKRLVDKSWCDYAGEGYRDWNHEILVDMPHTNYSKTIVSYLKDNNYTC